ncbi:DUF637 domain-containing protein [Pseudoalteromonas obscura]|uniref:DUF637 domain-containing protein n=1 Tax=Pseudoalteromonas obscura TaxID=3048491 RepID=A0ABT7EMC1_9GAMM|nr:DUF637 domain-containing protein [Pseudoalteromonas sp. P94(2023)]MDK2596181.1 DUF637 domain-containing protein [Pseudoalteromonas sp. P94(2023)]
MNTSMENIKRSLWHKATSYGLTLFMMLQLTLPSVASALTSVSNEQVQHDLTSEQMFIRSVVSDYLYQRSSYIPKPSSAYGNQSIAEFHSKLKTSAIYRLPNIKSVDYIPITGNITFFVPKKRTTYPLQKQVGDNFVQKKLIGSQIKRQIGRTYYKDTFTSEQQQINQLYVNAMTVAKRSSFTHMFGAPLPSDIADTLNIDFIWPESRNIAGNYVLVPVVHLRTSVVDAQSIDGTHTVEFRKSNASFKSASISNADLKIQRDASFSTINDLVIGSKSSITLSSGASNIYAGVSYIEDGRGNIKGVASGTLYNYGQINAARNVKIVAGNYEQKTFVHRFRSAHGYEDHLGTVASINAGGSISINTYGNMVFEGATANAAGGSIKLNSNGSIYIGAAKLENAASFKIKGGQKNEKGISYVQSILSARDNISLYAAGVIEIKASELHADKGIIDILGQNGVYILNELGEQSSSYNRKWGKTTEQEQQLQTMAIHSALEAGKSVKIASHLGDITLKATKIKSGTGTSIEAPNGRINLLLAIQQKDYFYNKVRKGTWKIKTETKQDQVDTAVYNEIIGGVKVHATHGLTLELGQYEGEDISHVVNQFAGSDSLSWMADIYNDPRYNCPSTSSHQAPVGYNAYAYEAMRHDPDFQHCNNLLDVVYHKLEKIHIHEKTSTLSPAAMAIIAIAVSVAMGPQGAGWIGSKGAIATAVGQGTFSAAALSAGAATLTTQAVTSLANGEGIDGAIKSIVDSDNLRSLAISMATAGVLKDIDAISFFEVDPNVASASAQALASVGNQALQIVADSAARAGIETVIQGGNFGTLTDSFVAGLRSGAVSALGRGITSQIESFDISEASKYIAHAATGCLLANVSSTNGNNSQQCLAGASGSVAAKFVASRYDHRVDKLTKQGEDVAAWLEKHVGVDPSTLSEKELNYFLNTHKVSAAELSQWNRFKVATSEVRQLQEAGADISRLVAGLTAFVAKGSSEVISRAAEQGGNVTYSSLMREMSPQYQQATALLAVLDEHHILQSAQIHGYKVEDIKKENILLPSAYNDPSIAPANISGRDLLLLQEIAILETLSVGTPEQKAKLIETYGNAVVENFSNTDGQILRYNWRSLGREAITKGPWEAFNKAYYHVIGPAYDNVQGAETLREIFRNKRADALEDWRIIDAIAPFAGASRYVAVSASQAAETVTRNVAARAVSEGVDREKLNFVNALREKTKVLLEIGDGRKPEVKNRTAIAQFFEAGKQGSESALFYNFTGNPSKASSLVTKGYAEWIEKDKSIAIKNVKNYLDYIAKKFYTTENGGTLHPIMRQRISDYLEYIKANNIPIPNGTAGAPGLHAEVRAVNWYLNNVSTDLTKISIATFKLKGQGVGEAFTACQNCSGILKGLEILTDMDKYRGGK